MQRWDEYLTQDRKDQHQEVFYAERLRDETDEATKKLFESKLAALADPRHVQQQNVTNVNKKVRQIVTELCKSHNTSLAEQKSRKRKSPEKNVVVSSARGTLESKKKKSTNAK